MCCRHFTLGLLMTWRHPDDEDGDKKEHKGRVVVERCIAVELYCTAAEKKRSTKRDSDVSLEAEPWIRIQTGIRGGCQLSRSAACRIYRRMAPGPGDGTRVRDEMGPADPEFINPLAAAAAAPPTPPAVIEPYCMKPPDPRPPSKEEPPPVLLKPPPPPILVGVPARMADDGPINGPPAEPWPPPPVEPTKELESPRCDGGPADEGRLPCVGVAARPIPPRAPVLGPDDMPLMGPLPPTVLFENAPADKLPVRTAPAAPAPPIPIDEDAPPDHPLMLLKPPAPPSRGDGELGPPPPPLISWPPVRVADRGLEGAGLLPRPRIGPATPRPPAGPAIWPPPPAPG